MSRWRCPGCGYTYDEQAGTRARASRRARRGARCPRTGPARTAACARRSTSRWRVQAGRSRRLARWRPSARARAHPLRAAARELLRGTLLDGPATSSSAVLGRRSRWPTSPPPQASAARRCTRSSARVRRSRKRSCCARATAAVAVEQAVREHLDDPATALLQRRSRCSSPPPPKVHSCARCSPARAPTACWH